MSEKYTELAKAVSSARAKAAAVGPQYALWDAIMDAEALMNEEPTIVPGNDEKRVENLIKMLKSDVIRVNGPVVPAASGSIVDKITIEEVDEVFAKSWGQITRP
jgi:hypothetical protein